MSHQGPGTRQRLLPLLPFGPDGVGRAAAARPIVLLRSSMFVCQGKNSKDGRAS